MLSGLRAGGVSSLGRAGAVAVAVGGAVAGALPARGQLVDLARYRSWGIETYDETVRTLGVPGTGLYAETAALGGAQSGGVNGRAFVWPESTQLRVLDALARIQPGTYAPVLRAFSDQVQSAYWNAGYRSGAGGGDRFYDDNGHMVVGLAEAYRVTGDATYLTRAKDAFSFVLSGEDGAGGGGIYFRQGDFSSKDAISTLQGARAAAMLYRATGQQSYLDDATRLMTWARSHVQQADGTFNQGWSLSTNSAAGVDLVNSAGIGISANLELYDATGNAGYLSEAQRIANRTLTRYFDSATGRINDEGYWAFELVDGLDNLYLHDRNPTWILKVNTALTWLHDNKEDPNGHYGLFWGRNGAQVGALGSWNLNDQAAVARAYLETGAIPEPGAVGVVMVGVGMLLGRRRCARVPGDSVR